MSFDYPEYIKSNREFLGKLSSTKSIRKTKKLLSGADSNKILAIVKIVYNVLKGRIPLKNTQRRKLATNADAYRSIARSRSEQTARHRVQTGGSIGLLAPIIAPVLGALAQQLLDKTLLQTATK